MSPKILDAALAYLGRHLDDIKALLRTQKLDIDLGDSSKQLESAARNLSQLSAALVKDKNVDHAAMNRSLLVALFQVEKAIKTIKLPDSVPTNKLLRDIAVAIKSKETIVEATVDMSAILQVKRAVEEATKAIEYKNINAIEDKLSRVISLLENLKFPKLPDTIKLDDMQFRTLRNVGAVGMAGSGGGGQLLARKSVVANTAMTAASTEYSYTFPINTVAFTMKLRAQDAKFQYSWVSGESGTTYMTVPENFLRSVDGVDYGSKIIYFQSATAAMTMETESFQV